MSYLENITLLTRSAMHHRRLISPCSSTDIDGSKNAFLAIDELALLKGPFYQKVFTLYACGIHDYKKEVLDPRQVLSMMISGDTCRYDRSVKRLNGMANGTFCCIAPTKKMDLLGKLGSKVDSIAPNFSEHSFLLENLRKTLMTMGVDRNRLEALSDKALITFVIANETQLLLAIIHPFWERNGRTSEEAMHLVCATNGVRKFVFWDDVKQRYNEITRERMDLIDKLAISLLPEVAKRMELEIGNCELGSVHDLYKLWNMQKGSINIYLLLNYLQKHTLVKYFQTKSACLGSPNLMRSYLNALCLVVEDRINRISQDNLAELIKDPINQQLVANHLIKGKEVNIHQLINS